MLIDGPSGAGKTTLAAALSQNIGFQVIHLDDFYPGWGGLAKASRMVAEDVLHPVRPGFWRWDWENDCPDVWVNIDPHIPLIIEGAGAVTGASKSAAARRGAVLMMKIDAPTPQRRRRALERDRDYAPWWDMWAAQEAHHFRGAGALRFDVVVR